MRPLLATGGRSGITVSFHFDRAAAKRETYETGTEAETFYTHREVNALIEQWRRHHNTARPHSSIG